jgi:hypothetical protein
MPAFVIAFASLGVPTLGGAVLLAIAGLGRETVFLAWPARQFIDGAWFSSWRRWVVDGAVTVAPLALWMLSLQLRFGGGGAGVDGGNLGLPLSGLASRIGEISAQFSVRPIASAGDLILHPAMQSCMLLVSVLAQMVYLITRPSRKDPIWRWGIFAGGLVLCLGWPTWEAFYTITRHLLPLHMAFNLLLARSLCSHRWSWFALGNLYAIPRVLLWISFP